MGSKKKLVAGRVNVYMTAEAKLLAKEIKKQLRLRSVSATLLSVLKSFKELNP